MDRMLLFGRTQGGTISMLIEDATWATVASVADGIQAICPNPIEWVAYTTRRRSVGAALADHGLYDAPITAPCEPEPVPA